MDRKLKPMSKFFLFENLVNHFKKAISLPEFAGVNYDANVHVPGCTVCVYAHGRPCL